MSLFYLLSSICSFFSLTKIHITKMSTIAVATTTEPTITSPTSEIIFSMPSDTTNLLQNHTAALQEGNMHIRLYNHMIEENIRQLTRNITNEETISSIISSLTILSYTIVTTLVWKSDYKIASLVIAAFCFLSTLINSIFRWRNNFDLFGKNRGEFLIQIFTLLVLIGQFLWFFFKLIDNLDIIRITTILLLVVCIDLIVAAVISHYIFREFEIPQRLLRSIIDNTQDFWLVFLEVREIIIENLEAEMLWRWELLPPLLRNALIL